MKKDKDYKITNLCVGFIASIVVPTYLLVLVLALPTAIYLAVLVFIYLYSGVWYSFTPNQLGLSKTEIFIEPTSWIGLIDLLLKVGDWNLVFAIPAYLWMIMMPFVYVTILLTLVRSKESSKL